MRNLVQFETDRGTTRWGLKILVMTYKSQSSPWMFGRDTIDQHVCLRGHYRRVDESKEEESTNQGTNRSVRSVWVFSLFCIRDREKPNREKDAPPLSRQPDRAGMTREAKNTHPGQTSYLLTDPPDTIRYGLFTFNDGAQKRIGDFHKHRQSRYDDGLNIRVGGRNFWRDTAGERRWERACVFLDLLDHLFIDLVFRRAGRNGKRLLIYEHKTRR